jgi:hypothetical protein
VTAGVEPTRTWVGPGFRDRLVVTLAWVLLGCCSRRFRARARQAVLVMLGRFAAADRRAGRPVVVVAGSRALQHHWEVCRFCGEPIHAGGRWRSELDADRCPLSPLDGLPHLPLVVPQQRPA